MTFPALAVTSSHADWRCPTCRLAARARAGLYSIPNNPLIVAAIQAICAGGMDATQVDGGWRRDRSGAPIFEFWSGSGGHIFVSIEAAPGEAWADLASYSALTLDCAVAILAALAGDSFRAQTSAPRRGHVWLGAPAVLAAKGYRRFGAERAAFAEVVNGEIEKLLRLRFELVNYPAFDPATRKWNRAGVSGQGLTLFEWAPDAYEDDAHNCSQGMPLRFGAWSENWLNAGGALWVSSFPQTILQLDHRGNRGADVLAKKVGALLTLNWGAARNGKEVCMEVRTLLRRIGELRRPGASVNAHLGRLADRLEEALLRLSESGVLHGDMRAEQAWLRRTSSQRWCEDWLDSVIVFPRPSFLGAPEVMTRPVR